jgi:uncharacterized protein YoxC
MTSTSKNEPTLVDVIEKLDNLSTNVDQLLTDVGQLSTRVDRLSADSERFNDRVSNYQQATQWVVQLQCYGSNRKGRDRVN